MNKRKAIIMILCAVLLACAVCAPAAAQETSADIDSIISYELKENGADDVQQWIDGALCAGAGRKSEWFILALVRSGAEYDFSRYAAALQGYIEENSVSGATARERIALTFAAIGYDSNYIEEAAENSIGEQGLMSCVYGLHLINAGVSCPKTAQEVISAIAREQLPDGGWAVTGENADPDTTAMVLQAMAQYSDEYSEMIEPALDYLSAAQHADGGYSSFGTACPESAAQVLIALTAMGIDPLGDARFIKNGNTVVDGILKYRLPDGGFCHEAGGEANQTAAMQSLMALTALWRWENGLDGFYAIHADKLKPIDKSAAGLPAYTPSPDDELILPGGDPEKSEMPAWKIAAFSAIGALTLATIVIFAVKRKKSWKNYALVVIAAGACAFVVNRVDIKSTQSYYGAETDGALKTTICIRCDTVAGEREFIPDSGIVLDDTEINLPEGASAYDQLVAAARQYGLQLDSVTSAAYGTTYIKGLAYLYEYDFGELSGWMYSVNGEFANVGCGEYKLAEGDRVVWEYTCELGNDLGEDTRN